MPFKSMGVMFTGPTRLCIRSELGVLRDLLRRGVTAVFLMC
jgi:hypothetical protein